MTFLEKFKLVGRVLKDDDQIKTLLYGMSALVYFPILIAVDTYLGKNYTSVICNILGYLFVNRLVQTIYADQKMMFDRYKEK